MNSSRQYEKRRLPTRYGIDGIRHDDRNASAALRWGGVVAADWPPTDAPIDMREGVSGADPRGVVRWPGYAVMTWLQALAAAGSGSARPDFLLFGSGMGIRVFV